MFEPEISKMDEIKSGAAEAESGNAQFMQPGTKVKAKRGPYKKEGKTKKAEAKSESGTAHPDQPKPGSDESIAQTAMILKPVFAIGSQLVAKWADTPEAMMMPSELETVSAASASIIEKYMPSMLDKYGAELILFTTVGMYGARVVTLKRARDVEKGRVSRNGGANQQTAPFHPPQVQTNEIPNETVVQTDFASPN